MNYILFGEEEYRLKKTLTTIISEYVKEEDTLNVIKYDMQHTDLDVIIADAMTIPFFSPYKVIIVYHANFLSTTNDTTIDTHKLIEYLKQPNESTILIFVGNFSKLDTRKKVIKEIKSYCKIYEFHKLDEQGMKAYLNEEIKRRNLKMDAYAIHELVKRIGVDIELLHRELDKLELYGENITKESVISLVSKPLEEDVFTLVDAVVNKDIDRAFMIWKDFCVKHIDAIYLIALLAGQFRFLYEVKVLMMQGKLKTDIASILKAHPYRVQLAMQKVQVLSQHDMMKMLSKLSLLDQSLKSGSLDKKLGFEMFLLELRGVS